MAQQQTGSTSPTSLRGIISIWLAVLIFAAAGSVVQLLTQLGAMHPVEGRNPISFCNVLFIGNLFAFFALSIIYRKQCTFKALCALRIRDWMALIFLAFISATLAPSLIFIALERTDVIHVLLLGRIEPVIFIVLAVIIFGDRPDRWSILAMLFTITGVIVALGWQVMGNYMRFGSGEIMVIAAALISAFGSIISKFWLKTIPFGIFLVFRTGMGAIIFFWIAVYLFGFDHFQDAFSPFLWKWMLAYVAIIVVGGQIVWFTGLKSGNAVTIALAGTFLPIAGIGFAILILDRTPTLPILAGCVFFFIAFAFAGFGAWKKHKKQRRLAAYETDALVLEENFGFKGV